MDWDKGKTEHLHLADLAATVYGAYAATSSATASYMRYEEQVIREAAAGTTTRNRALDLGCGEGRISFHSADLFDEVIGFDMSSEMVRVADQRRLELFRGNTRFIVRDLEADLLSDIGEATTDLVVASFGMGSFFEDLDRLLHEISRVMHPGGKAVLSFYNRESLVQRLTLPSDWQASLAAVIDDYSNHGLVVALGDRSFDISARAYSAGEVTEHCRRYFDDVSVTTFPSISAVLPQVVSGHPRAIEVCDRIDHALAENAELNLGAYILAVVSNDYRPTLFGHRRENGYARLLRVLRAGNVRPRVVEHAPVRTMEEALLATSAPQQRMLKSVLLRVDNPEPHWLLCVVASERRVSLDKVGRELGVTQSRIRLATSVEVESATGFSVGELSPIGMPNDVPVILDAAAWASAREEEVWCGSGKRTESFVLPLHELVAAVGPSVRDISSPST